MSPSTSSQSLQLPESAPTRSRSGVPTPVIAAALGAGLTLVLHFLMGSEAALAGALLGFAAVIGLSLTGMREESFANADSSQLDTFLKELRTIPAVSPNVRLELNAQSPALRSLLNSLPPSSKASLEGFLDRATRRVRDGDALPRIASASPASPAATPAPVPAQSHTQASGSALKIDAILIDDEESVHMAWKVAAGRAGKTVLTFKSVEDILALPGLSRIPLETRFVVDSHLAQGTKGVVAAKALHDRGFRNLALAHPEPKKLLEPMPTWISQVIDKRPQFI